MTTEVTAMSKAQYHMPLDQRIPQRLHDSEINGSISWFFDGGFTAQIGDPLNGIRAEEQCRSLDEALAWLDAKARELYPQSDYVRS